MIFTAPTFQWLIEYFYSKKPVRYITSCNVIFGRYIPMLQMTAKNVAGGRLRVYDTVQECNAGKPSSGKPQKIIDTYKNPVLNKVIIPKFVLQKLMDSPASPYDYLKNNDFTVSCFHEGKIKWFRYQANYMMMTVGTTTDENAYEKIEAAAELETSCNEFVQLAQRNGKTLADLALRKLSATQNNKLKAEIKLHEQVIKKFTTSLPDGFYADTRILKPNALSVNNLTVQIGVLPLVAIYWVAGIVVAGVVAAYSINQLIKSKTEIEKLKALLEDRGNSIRSITDESMRNDEYVKAAGDDGEIIKIKAKGEVKADTATSWLGELKQIVIVAAVALTVKELLPLFTKKTGK